MLKRAHEHVHTDDAPVAKQLKGILKLNVGGKAFTSTASTLEGSPFFAVLLSGRFEEPRDEEEHRPEEGHPRQRAPEPVQRKDGRHTWAGHTFAKLTFFC